MNKSIDFEDNNSKKLLVIFGGIKMGVGIPQFEFKNSLKEIDADKLFIRDKSQQWYQKGIDNHESLFELKTFLSNFLEEKNYDQVCFLGNSMGAYIAILLGSKLNIDTVLAFSPQTFMDLKNKFLFRDFRWMKHATKMAFLKDTELDLVKSLNRSSSDTRIDIYFGKNHNKDIKHANRLLKYKNVMLHPVENDSHNVVRSLRDNGQLYNIISNALAEADKLK